MARKRQTHTRRQQEQMARRQRARARQLAQSLAHAEAQDAVTHLTGIYAAAGDALMTAVAQDAPTPAKVYDAVRNAFTLVDQHLAEAQTPVACRAGCAWCCHQAITTTVPEVFLIASQVKKRLTPEEQVALRQRLETNVAAYRRQGPEHYNRANHPCAFLQTHGQCRIYEIRPLLCRGYHSTDVNACRQAYEQQTPISPAVTPQNLLAPALGMAHGLALGAGEAEWAPTQIDLQTGVLIALETPDATQQWLDGKEIFLCHRFSRSTTSSSTTAISKP